MYSEYLKIKVNTQVYVFSQRKVSSISLLLIQCNIPLHRQTLKKKKWRKAQHLLPPFCTSCSHYCPFQLRFCPYHYMKQLLVRSTVMSLSFNSVHAFFYLPLLWQPCFYKHLLALTLWPSCSERFSEHAIFSITFI